MSKPQIEYTPEGARLPLPDLAETGFPRFLFKILFPVEILISDADLDVPLAKLFWDHPDQKEAFLPVTLVESFPQNISIEITTAMAGVSHREVLSAEELMKEA